MVSKHPDPDVTMGNTVGAGVLSLPNYDGMLLEEESKELFEIVESLQTLKYFQVTSQKR